MAQDHVALTGHGGSSPLPGTSLGTGLAVWHRKPGCLYVFGGRLPRRPGVRDGRAILSRRLAGLFLAFGDRRADQIAPFGPGAVIILDVLEAEQVLEHEPGVARALADAAVGDDRLGIGFQAGFLQVERLEVVARF